MTLIQADALYLPYPSNHFHAIVTSPPYWGLRRYLGDQGEEPLGLEATPERHIERMVEVFREVRRVLRDDGVVWLNYGDCYGGSWGNYGSRDGGQRPQNTDALDRPGVPAGDYRPPTSFQKNGNLMLMPHRLAIALQDDGWIVRNDLVWFKRNPMPESVAGWRFENGKLRKSSWRHTRAHEYVFQLVKKMGYFCNQEAARVPHDQPWRGKGESENWITGEGIKKGKGRASDTMSGWGKRKYNPSGRNPRSVLDVPTAPYKGAHYATFPPKLIAPLIRASVPRRCCPECGMAWAPVVDKGFEPQDDVSISKGIRGHDGQKPMDESSDWQGCPRGSLQSTVTDYRPTCECGIEEHEPGIVLDIFGGSGTTGMVAKELLRRWVVMDISRPYLDEQAKVRTGSGMPANALDGLPMFEAMT